MAEKDFNSPVCRAWWTEENTDDQGSPYKPSKKSGGKGECRETTKASISEGEGWISIPKRKCVGGSAPAQCSYSRLPACLPSESNERHSISTLDKGVCFKKLNGEDPPTRLLRVGDQEDDTRRWNVTG